MKKLIFLAGVCVNSVLAGEPAIDEPGIARSAAADGSLIAMALFCNLNPGEIRKLAAKQEAETLELAQKYKVHFDSKAYREEAKAGMESTAAVIRQIQPGTDSYVANCREALDKIQRKLAP